MRFAIVGSREYPCPNIVRATVRGLRFDDVLISGGARGVDTLAEREALARGLEVVSYRPQKESNGEWVIYRYTFEKNGNVDIDGVEGDPRFKNFGQAALYRNGLIVADADRIAAFWDEESRGTQNAIGHAKRLGKDFRIVGKSGEVIGAAGR